MDMLFFVFALFFFATIISWIIVFITSIFQPDRFKKYDDNDMQDSEQGWPF